jgi:hypothetical protein
MAAALPYVAPPFLFDLPPAYVRTARLHAGAADAEAEVDAATTSAGEHELEELEADGAMEGERRTCNTCDAAFEDIYEQVRALWWG